jgi:ABC-type transporter Mla subunit MlaD
LAGACSDRAQVRQQLLASSQAVTGSLARSRAALAAELARTAEAVGVLERSSETIERASAEMRGVGGHLKQGGRIIGKVSHP